jgi:hypothetical protein
VLLLCGRWQIWDEPASKTVVKNRINEITFLVFRHITLKTFE